jgi:hypothetical protein
MKNWIFLFLIAMAFCFATIYELLVYEEILDHPYMIALILCLTFGAIFFTVLGVCLLYADIKKFRKNPN